MKIRIHFSLALLSFSLLAFAPLQAQSFEIATDSTGKPYAILEDGSISYDHPALKYVRKSGYLKDLEEPEVETLPWQAYAEKARTQLIGSRICYVGAIVVPGVVFLVGDNPFNQALVGGGAGLLFGLLGLGLDAASRHNYNRSIHLHIDAQGAGIGIPLE